MHVVKLPGLELDVVVHLVGPELLVADQMFEVHIPASVGVAGLLVVVDFVGPQLDVLGLHRGAAAQMVHTPFSLLGRGADQHLVWFGRRLGGDGARQQAHGHRQRAQNVVTKAANCVT